MRNNFIGGGSVTGGTGALTLAAAGGLALPATAYVAGQAMDYSIIEYSDATLGTVVRAETGLGNISAANVLTRSRVFTTWNGTTYAQAAPSALSFGTSHVRVYCSPSAEAGPTSFPGIANFSSNYGTHGYVVPANCAHTAEWGGLALTANRQFNVPLKIEAGFAITEIGIHCTTAVAATTVNIAIASLNPTTEWPGVILAFANGLDTSSTGIKMGSITSRIFAPGWYWMLFNSGGTPGIRGSDHFIPGPMGAFSAATSRTHRGNHRARTQANYVLAADAMSGTSGSFSTADNVAYPTLLMR
jgi:hypothetical protein